MSMCVARFFGAMLIGFCVVACGEAKPATLSVEITNKTGVEVYVPLLRFTQSGTDYSLGFLQPNGGNFGHHGIAAPEPYNQIVVEFFPTNDPAKVRKSFKLDLKGMGKVNDIGRDEYHLEITDQGVRVIPPAEWPKPGDPPAKLPPITTPVLPYPKFIPGADSVPSLAPTNPPSAK